MRQLLFLACAASVLIGRSIAADSTTEADEKTLRTAGIGVDGPGLLNYFRARSVSTADQEKIRALIAQLGNDAYTLREQATAELISVGLPAVGLLRSVGDKDVEITRRAQKCLAEIEKVPSGSLSAAAARTLARIKPDGATSVLIAYLPFADDGAVADDVRDALSAMAVQSGKVDPAIEKALIDANPLLRGAAGEALARARHPAARALMTDADVGVRLRVTLAAVEFAKDKTAITPLIDSLVDLPQEHVWRAEDILIRLANDTAPPVSLGKTNETRKACRDAWAEWWTKSAEKTDLAKLDANPRLLGNTLIVINDTRGIGGQVYEIGPDRNILWKVDHLQQPSDAVIVGKDRVLISEYSSHQVTLRDFHGNTIWTRPNMIMPSGLQMLPNGNMLITSRNQFTELSEKQNEVFTYQRNQYDIAAACKNNLGEYWILTSAGNCMRIKPPNKEEASFSVGGARLSFAAMDALPDGHLLVTRTSGVTEFDTKGKDIWKVGTGGSPTSVQRLRNGDTLVAGMSDRSAVQFDRKGDAVWQYKPTEDTFIIKRARRR